VRCLYICYIDFCQLFSAKLDRYFFQKNGTYICLETIKSNVILRIEQRSTFSTYFSFVFQTPMVHKARRSVSSHRDMAHGHVPGDGHCVSGRRGRGAMLEQAGSISRVGIGGCFLRTHHLHSLNNVRMTNTFWEIKTTHAFLENYIWSSSSVNLHQHLHLSLHVLAQLPQNVSKVNLISLITFPHGPKLPSWMLLIALM
jgi:hypothetical protein